MANRFFDVSALRLPVEGRDAARKLLALLQPLRVVSEH
jgi:hypothetical protein